jgi:hypothetical protein
MVVEEGCGQEHFFLWDVLWLYVGLYYIYIKDSAFLSF